MKGKSILARETDYKDDKEFKKPICSCCGKEFTRQQDKFFKNNYSDLYKSNNGFLTVCKECVLERYEKYKFELDSAEDAMRLICQNFDMYFSLNIFESAKKLGKGYCSSYFARTNLMQGKDKTSINTLKEEAADKIRTSLQVENEDISEDTVRFWGTGYTISEYKMLDEEYSSWVVNKNNGDKPNKSLETVFKQSCMILIDLQRARASGKTSDITSLSKAYLDCLTSAGLKPIQEDNTSVAEKNSLGVLIEKWEQSEPVPEISSEFADVDKIKHYIDVFFKGHLCRMFGMKNDTQDVYDEEISKYKVKPPTIEDGDNNVI